MARSKTGRIVKNHNNALVVAVGEGSIMERFSRTIIQMIWHRQDQR